MRLRAIGWVLLAAAGMLFPLAVLAAYDVTGSSAPEPFETGFWSVEATVDIKPESLQKRSQGQPITAFIELAFPFDAANIKVPSMLLCLGTEPCAEGVAPDGAPGAKPKVGDFDNDGIPDLKVTFDRGDVLALVDVSPPGTVTFAVSGVVDPPSRTFVGSDTVRLVDPELEPTSTPTPEPTLVPTAEPTPSPTATSEARPTPPSVAEEYEVQPGDTLTAIAARFGTTVEALVRLNRLQNANLILYGSTLNVPYVGHDAGGASAGVSP